MGELIQAIQVGVVGAGLVGGFFFTLFVVMATLYMIGVCSLYLSTKLMGFRESGFFAAIGACLLIGAANLIFTTVFSVIPVIGTLVGWLAAIAASVKIVEGWYDTTTSGAVACVVLHWIVSTALVVGLAIAFGGGLTFMAALFS